MIYFFNRIGVRQVTIYVVIGVAMISAIFGCVLLLLFMPKSSETPVGAHEQKAGNKEKPGTEVSEENGQAKCKDHWREDGRDDQH